MTLWFVLALMTAAAIFAVLWPLGRRAAPRAGSDVAVYRDQLDEIERDRAAGVIGGREAEAARVEVARRLIAADEARARTETPADQNTVTEQATPAAFSAVVWRRRAVALAALVLLPLGCGSLYLALGSPNLPDEPLTARRDTPPDTATDQQPIAELLARVEAHLEQNPDDGRGWEVVAPVYMKLGRYDDAVKARRHVLSLLGETPAREADLGEALTGQANGIVTADAKAAFERARQHNPNEFKARYFLGLAAEQDGRPADAAKAWGDMLAEAPTDAPWIDVVRESLLRVKPDADVPKSAAPQPGPSADDVASAADMTDAQRATMVRGMVDRLAERLAHDGSDADGWLRLVRAYMVLGERDKAQAAVGDARKALTAEPDKLRRVEQLVKDLGIDG